MWDLGGDCVLLTFPWIQRSHSDKWTHWRVSWWPPSSTPGQRLPWARPLGPEKLWQTAAVVAVRPTLPATGNVVFTNFLHLHRNTAWRFQKKKFFYLSKWVEFINCHRNKMVAIFPISYLHFICGKSSKWSSESWQLPRLDFVKLYYLRLNTFTGLRLDKSHPPRQTIG